MTPRLATIADRIRWVIHTRGLTQQGFAGRADMAPSQLSVLLKRLDERPYAIELETVLRLAHAGRVAPRWLLLGEGDPFGQEGEPEAQVHPPLRELPGWEHDVVTLRRRGFVLPSELLGWVGSVSLPLEDPLELTPEIIVSLARMRLQMQYKRTLMPIEYVPPSLPVQGESTPPAVRRGSRKKTSRTGAKKAPKRRGGTR
jgi:transcriptional regulator with XRE-family HTH domain